MSEATLLEAWKQHTLLELGGILAAILEYEQPEEVAFRLETIAWELRNHFGGNERNVIPMERRTSDLQNDNLWQNQEPGQLPE